MLSWWCECDKRGEARRLDVVMVTPLRGNQCSLYHSSPSPNDSSPRDPMIWILIFIDHVPASGSTIRIGLVTWNFLPDQLQDSTEKNLRDYFDAQTCAQFSLFLFFLLKSQISREQLQKRWPAQSLPEATITSNAFQCPSSVRDTSSHYQPFLCDLSVPLNFIFKGLIHTSRWRPSHPRGHPRGFPRSGRFTRFTAHAPAHDTWLPHSSRAYTGTWMGWGWNIMVRHKTVCVNTTFFFLSFVWYPFLMRCDLGVRMRGRAWCESGVMRKSTFAVSQYGFLFKLAAAQLKDLTCSREPDNIAHNFHSLCVVPSWMSNFLGTVVKLWPEAVSSESCWCAAAILFFFLMKFVWRLVESSRFLSAPFESFSLGVFFCGITTNYHLRLIWVVLQSPESKPTDVPRIGYDGCGTLSTPLPPGGSRKPLNGQHACGQQAFPVDQLRIFGKMRHWPPRQEVSNPIVQTESLKLSKHKAVPYSTPQSRLNLFVLLW